jgi:hypothetical protein
LLNTSFTVKKWIIVIQAGVLLFQIRKPMLSLPGLVFRTGFVNGIGGNETGQICRPCIQFGYRKAVLIM